MAELQKSIHSGELAQRFIALVLRQAQQISLCLGLLPLPGQEKPEVHIDVARLLIDELEMLSEKTRGNLSDEETRVLGSVLAELRIAFVQVSSGKTASPPPETGSPGEEDAPASQPSGS